MFLQAWQTILGSWRFFHASRQPLQLVRRATGGEPVRHIGLVWQVRQSQDPDRFRYALQRPRYIGSMFFAGFIGVRQYHHVTVAQMYRHARQPLAGTAWVRRGDQAALM